MASSDLPTNFETDAIVVLNPGDDFKLMPIVLDEVRDDELLIEMKYSGICHTVSRLGLQMVPPRNSRSQNKCVIVTR